MILLIWLLRLQGSFWNYKNRNKSLTLMNYIIIQVFLSKILIEITTLWILTWNKWIRWLIDYKWLAVISLILMGCQTRLTIRQQMIWPSYAPLHWKTNFLGKLLQLKFIIIQFNNSNSQNKIRKMQILIDKLSIIKKNISMHFGKIQIKCSMKDGVESKLA